MVRDHRAREQDAVKELSTWTSQGFIRLILTTTATCRCRRQRQDAGQHQLNLLLLFKHTFGRVDSVSRTPGAAEKDDCAWWDEARRRHHVTRPLAGRLLLLPGAMPTASEELQTCLLSCSIGRGSCGYAYLIRLPQQLSQLCIYVAVSCRTERLHWHAPAQKLCSA